MVPVASQHGQQNECVVSASVLCTVCSSVRTIDFASRATTRSRNGNGVVVLDGEACVIDEVVLFEVEFGEVEISR